jgi:hypothetical protein
MSEYSFYEFRTVNRTLTRAEQQEISSWSSRSDATPTGAKFIYNYGSFKHEPEKCLLGYFDMYLHYCNYGVRQVMFRFPKNLVKFQDLKQYDRAFSKYEYEISVKQKGEYVLIDIQESDESGEGFDWIDCEDTLGAITSLWTDIAKGNYASLYAIWMHFASLTINQEDDDDEDMDDDEDEDMDYDDEDDDDDMDDDDDISQPPVPAGMQKINGALSEFATFWGISQDFLTALGKNSAPKEEIKIDYKKAITLLSDAEKSAFLLQIVEDKPQVQLELIKKLEQISGIKSAQPQQANIQIKDILALEAKMQADRIAAEKAAVAEKRLKELQAMVGKEKEMWVSVRANIAEQKSTGYKIAVQILGDLRDLASYLGKSQEFRANMEALKEKHATSKALLTRFRDNRL